MILLLDNYDSYTFNLAHLIAEVDGRHPLVIAAGEAEGLAERVRAGECMRCMQPWQQRL